jgi:hypothetical protein
MSVFSAAEDYKDYNHSDDNDYKYFTLTEQYTKHSDFVFLIYYVLYSVFVSNIQHESIFTALFCQAGWRKYLVPPVS